VVTNQIAKHVAGRAPGFGIVEHVGRRSGTVRHTPVNVFRDGDRYVIALTYGSDSQWVRNVLAAGDCAVEYRRKRIVLEQPELVHDPTHRFVPAPIRPILSAIRVDDFLVFRPREPTPSRSA
jgi:deazaflavin-dependent oxidoreductase (nitroreductase family)